MFAEIILPLPLYATYTYAVPSRLEGMLQAGSRVLVQFGKKKYYTGLVETLHNNSPKGREVKEIIGLLDAAPIVRYPQLNLWKWISEYYLCSVGEVMRAALPSGLKPESETFVTLADERGERGERSEEGEDESGLRALTEKEASVIMALSEKKGRMKISEIEARTEIRNIMPVVNALMESGIVAVDEKVVERYRSKKESYVAINLERGDMDGLHGFFDLTRRSVAQEKGLIAWLDMSGWLAQGKEEQPVKKEDFLKGGVSPNVLRGMISKGIFRIEKREINRFNPRSEHHESRLAKLSEAQQRAKEEIVANFREKKITLLHGLTGSGKTEIYTHLIDKCLQEGNQALFLVPEISLTTQLTDRLRRVFGDRLLVYHSKFSDNERVDIWKRLLGGREPLVVIGARSSLFLPFARLGLVIVDEEHESSYKQYDPAPRYNARDTATVLASMHGADVLLGSATPSVETYYKTQQGTYGLVTLRERYEGSTLPDVTLVDMTEQRKKKLNDGILSAPLKEALDKALSEGMQGIVFQNRRGYAPMVVCRQCGWTPRCENCDVSLVYHKNTDLLKCHYCGFTQLRPRTCPACGSNDIATYGYGTERIAEEIHQKFEGKRVARMDLDTTRNKDSYQEIIEEFASQQTDILVGTQMVSKGLDFAKVKVVGVVNADTLLNFPDFRSNERGFNMLSQVAGRAGRRREKGEVVIQSTRPKDRILQYVAAHDYEGYYRSEILEREKYGYPPFTKIVNIYIKHKDALTADRAAVALALRLREIFGARVLGPEKPFVSRVALWYLQTIMLKMETGVSMKKVKKLLREVYEEAAGEEYMKGTQIYYDVDPG